ncbi:hypothetical protein DFJ73DRAFT_826677 [Zopfochytrium polystomum]|nr:hypothetical protein DFJ73DRAFT_826677 [Zopfochytrium polystomum]
MFERVRDAIASFLAQWPVRTLAPPYKPPSLPSADRPVLFIYPRSRHQSTSQEVESLKVQAVLTICGYPHIVEECFEEDQSPSGQLPYLLTRDGRALAGREILDEVEGKLADLASHLSSEDRGDVLAFAALAESKLHFALVYSLWYIQQNCETVTFPLYEGNHTWPLNLLLTRLKRSFMLDWMLARRSTLDREEIYGDAKVALEGLSTQLGEKPFLFGDRPTYTDAVVFAYIHIILTAFSNENADRQLRQYVQRYPNLVQFAERFSHTWFAKTNFILHQKQL